MMRPGRMRGAWCNLVRRRCDTGKDECSQWRKIKPLFLGRGFGPSPANSRLARSLLPSQPSLPETHHWHSQSAELFLGGSLIPPDTCHQLVKIFEYSYAFLCGGTVSQAKFLQLPNPGKVVVFTLAQ
ncbi:hypothetical protein DPSP01_009228 [Paraphaeosphaeria sporulosa]